MTFLQQFATFARFKVLQHMRVVDGVEMVVGKGKAPGDVMLRNIR